MERIYRLTYGPYYEEQELGYLTEDKLNDYLEELFHSTLMRNRVYSHLETLRARKAQYEANRHEAIQDMNKYLSILQTGKTNPGYKDAKRQYTKYERIVIDCKCRNLFCSKSTAFFKDFNYHFFLFHYIQSSLTLSLTGLTTLSSIGSQL